MQCLKEIPFDRFYIDIYPYYSLDLKSYPGYKERETRTHIATFNSIKNDDGMEIIVAEIYVNKNRKNLLPRRLT